MRLGVALRSMGPQSTRETLVAAARAADALPAIADLWVVDHIAIPLDDAEGSDGRYLDPLATLAYLAGVTSRVGLGTAVLVLPYRPALPTAKWIATVQELSGGRLSLRVGVGWMAAEFRRLRTRRRRPGRVRRGPSSVGARRPPGGCAPAGRGGRDHEGRGGSGRKIGGARGRRAAARSRGWVARARRSRPMRRERSAAAVR